MISGQQGAAAEMHRLLSKSAADTLAKEGFSQITNVRALGPSITATAIARNGLPARVVVDGETGRILGLRLLDPGELSEKPR